MQYSTPTDHLSTVSLGVFLDLYSQ